MSGNVLTAAPAIMLAVVLGALGAAFVVEFEDNLHCTQYTSFRMAVSDFQPHEEEQIEGGPPLVYRRPFAVPLRIYGASSLLAFLIGLPALGVFIAVKPSLYAQWKRALFIAAGALLVIGVVPNVVFGERFSALAWYALVGGLLPLALLTLLLQAAKRRGD